MHANDSPAGCQRLGDDTDVVQALLFLGLTYGAKPMLVYLVQNTTVEESAVSSASRPCGPHAAAARAQRERPRENGDGRRLCAHAYPSRGLGAGPASL